MSIFNLLGGVQPKNTSNLGNITQVISSIKTYLNYVMVGILSLMAIAGIIFAIWVAFKLAKAEDDGKRKEAKSHLMYAIIGIIAAAVVFVLLTTVFSGATFTNYEKVAGGNAVGDSVNQVLFLVSQAIGALFSLIAIAAMGFALYIAWKLMSADEENKRKQAKSQLVWTVIAIISVILINSILGTVLATLSGALQKESVTGGIFTLLSYVM